MKNIFFFVNQYYIYLLNHQPTISYNFHFIKNDYYLEIKNKNNQPLNIYFQIIKNNKCFKYKIHKEKSNFFKLESFDNLKFQDNFNMPSIDEILKLFPHFNFNFYKQNLNINSIDSNFLIYHWYYCGQFDKYQYWKYTLYKNAQDFYKLNELINYSIQFKNNKKYSFVFIDDRFDDIFIFILIMFKYCINDNWNLYIFSQSTHYQSYYNICKKLNIDFKYYDIEPFIDIQDYSNYLKNIDFWNLFQEEYMLIFQYDSCVFKKFNSKFFQYNYLGAQWPIHIQQNKGIFNGNGGTSLRNIKIMKYICEKYYYKLFDEKIPEDVYFSKYLYQEKLLENNPALCNDFSIENILYENSTFGHAIYECVPIESLENFLMNKIKKIIGSL